MTEEERFKILFSDYNLRDSNKKPFVAKTIIYHPDEIFKPIPFRFPNILVGDYGTVYNINTRMKIKPRMTSDGYLEVAVIDLLKGRQTVQRIQRLVLLAHLPVPENYEELYVNHINCIKTDNRLSNLEWCTPGENTLHAYKNGLNPWLKYSDEEVRLLCEGLNQGMMPKEAIINAGMEFNKSTRGLAHSLQKGKNRKDILKDYPNIHVYTPRLHDNRVYSADQVHRICQLISLGLNDVEVSNKYLEIYGELIPPVFICRIRYNKEGDTWWPIVSQYNIPRTCLPRVYTDAQIHMICRMMVESKTIDEMYQALGATDYNSRNTFVKFISDLRKGRYKKYRHITSQYFGP